MVNEAAGEGNEAMGVSSDHCLAQPSAPRDASSWLAARPTARAKIAGRHLVWNTSRPSSSSRSPCHRGNADLARTMSTEPRQGSVAWRLQDEKPSVRQHACFAHCVTRHLKPERRYSSHDEERRSKVGGASLQ